MLHNFMISSVVMDLGTHLNVILIISICLTKSPTPLETDNTRSFQFTYTVVIESTGGEKLELWIPVPQSNKVQTISNLKFNTRGLHHSIENEKSHGNTYLYINDEKGITKATNISMTFEVMRDEHQNMMAPLYVFNWFKGNYKFLIFLTTLIAGLVYIINKKM